jgi:hypothetical protein
MTPRMNRAMSLAAVIAFLALPATVMASITIPAIGHGSQGGEVATWQATLN